MDAPEIRPGYLGNYLRQDGFPPGTLARRFDAWNNLRSGLFRVWPWHAVVLYLMVGAGCVWCVVRSGVAAEWPLYPVCLVLAVCGAIEFMSSALLDCLETARHLFLLHVITEMLIVFAAAALPNLGGVLGGRCRPTARHLFFFHVLTEILVICGFAAVFGVECFKVSACPATARDESP